MARRRLYLSYVAVGLFAIGMFLYIRIYISNSQNSARQHTNEATDSEANKSSWDGIDLSYFRDSTNLTTLQLVQIIFRHGDRTPLYGFPLDKNREHDYGVKGFGQLTPKGRIRALELGKYLRNRYDGYLKPVYDLDEVYVQSSSADRTLMTAGLCLAGLYPGLPNSLLDFQPIPIHSISRSVDNKLGFHQTCPKHGKLYKEYLKSPYVKSINDASTELYEYLSAWSGLNITHYVPLYRLTDTLFIQKDSGLKLPDWAEYVYPSQTGHISQLEYMADTDTDEMKRLYLGPLLTELVKNMDVRLGKVERRGEEAKTFRNTSMFLYSAHDTTISNFLNSLGIFDGDKPAYASVIMLELHAQNTLDDADSTIKIFYKNNHTEAAEELQFPDCGDACRLDTFKQIYENLLIEPQQWNEECAQNLTSSDRRRITVNEVLNLSIPRSGPIVYSNSI